MRDCRANGCVFAVVAAFWLLPAPAKAAAESDGLGADKALHFSVSVGLTLGSALVLDAIGIDEPAVLPLSIGFALTLGIGKEAFDELVRDTGFSLADLSWDLLGITTGVLLDCILRALLPPARKPPPELSRARAW
jgi:uncharacterized protein YfiM (DUF2279 family)